jgi:large subunit ribosomal protein L18
MGTVSKQKRKIKRKARVRGKVFGVQDRPRLAVTRTLKNTYAQIINDEQMVTLTAASSLTKELVEKLNGKTKTEGATIIGDEIARRALEKGIKKVTFDRSGNLYHGRIKALAEAARKAGLEF